ncbi:MAG TPA: SDR family oxidoreductase [Ktedonobacteraceae bacterium]
MYTYQGKTALITGASSGIGKAFAQALAARGTNLILVARSENILHELAQQLTQQHGISATVLAADLCKEEALATIQQEVQTRGLSVDLLINNAGFATYGHFETLDAQRDREEVLVNVAAVVELSHAFLPSMVARGAGAIINVASLGSFQPAPYMAVYGASKAFVLSFSEALWAEYRAKGIHVIALCPGPVATSFFDRVGSDEEPAVGAKVKPEMVVMHALRVLERRQRSVVIPGWSNSVLSLLPRMIPRRMTARLVESLLRPGKAGAGR